MSFRIHLKGKGHSERMVRYRVLAPSEIEHAELQAARELGKDAKVAEYESKIARNALSMMIVAVSAPVAYETQEREMTRKGEDGKDVVEKTKLRVARIDLALPTFEKLTAQQLEERWDQLFTTKDSIVLRRLHDEEHTVTKAELDEILEGKAEEVD